MSAANSPVNKVVLYQTWGSSCAFRVRICLHLKGISYDKILVNQSTPVDENREKSHALNPMKFVPVLQVDGHSLIESLAIMEYLEELKPEPSLLPKDLFKRANVRAICNIIVSGIQPLQNTGVLNLITEYTDDDKRKTWAKHWITKGFDALEQMLVNNSGAYCVGDEITFADCCLVPQVINARRWKYFKLLVNDFLNNKSFF